MTQRAMAQVTMTRAMVAQAKLPKRTMAKGTLMRAVEMMMTTGCAAVLEPSRYRLAACPWNSTPCPHSGATTDYRSLNLDAGSDFGR